MADVETIHPARNRQAPAHVQLFLPMHEHGITDPATVKAACDAVKGVLDGLLPRHVFVLLVPHGHGQDVAHGAGLALTSIRGAALEVLRSFQQMERSGQGVPAH